MKRPIFREVSFTVSVEVSTVPLRGNLCAISAEVDARAEHRVAQRVNADDVWAWCDVTVKAQHDGLEGVCVMGAVSTTERRFKRSRDFREMKREAFGALRAVISERNASALTWGYTLDKWHDQSRALHLLDGSGAPRCGARYFASAGQVSRAHGGTLCKRCERIALAGLTTHLADPRKPGHCMCGEQADALTLRKRVDDVDCFYCKQEHEIRG